MDTPPISEPITSERFGLNYPVCLPGMGLLLNLLG